MFDDKNTGLDDTGADINHYIAAAARRCEHVQQMLRTNASVCINYNVSCQRKLTTLLGSNSPCFLCYGPFCMTLTDRLMGRAIRIVAQIKSLRLLVFVCMIKQEQSQSRYLRQGQIVQKCRMLVYLFIVRLSD